MQEIVNPIAVELDETARVMRIRWDDGHLGEWGWMALRRACPCALCAGEGNLLVSDKLPGPELALTLIARAMARRSTPLWSQKRSSSMATTASRTWSGMSSRVRSVRFSSACSVTSRVPSLA